MKRQIAEQAEHQIVGRIQLPFFQGDITPHHDIVSQTVSFFFHTLTLPMLFSHTSMENEYLERKKKLVSIPHELFPDAHRFLCIPDDLFLFGLPGSSYDCSMKEEEE